MKDYPGISVRQHHTDQKQMGLLRERYAERKKGHLRYCRSTVWVTNGGRVLWNVTAICGTYKISCLMGRHLTRGDSENHLKGPIIPFGAMVENHLFLPKTCRDCISSARKSYQVHSSTMQCTLGGIWKGDILVADIEESEQMDASKIHTKRLNAKEVLTLMNGGKVHMPNRRWNGKILWRRSGSENIHVNPGQPRPRRRTRKSSRRIRRVLFKPISRLIAG